MSEVEALGPRQVVVSALPLKRSQLAVLSEQLGAGFRLVDIREAPGEVDVVLCPPCSPQTIGRLRAAFPSARILAVELHDHEAGLHVEGPLGRILAGGAAGYLLASSGYSIGEYLAAARLQEELPAASPPELPQPVVDDFVTEQLEALARARSERR